MSHPSLNWSRAAVLLTGASGFLGQAIARAVRAQHPALLSTPAHQNHNLQAPAAARHCVADFARGARRDTLTPLIIHAAARSGGLGDVRARPGDFFTDNLSMAMNLVEACHTQGIAIDARAGGLGGAFILIGHMTMYPDHIGEPGATPRPLAEDDLYAAALNPNTAPLGMAKLAAWEMLRAYHAQYSMRGLCLIPTNLYGRADYLDPARHHFVGMTIRRVLEAVREGKPSITCWGTGSPMRDFLHVDDAAAGVIAACGAALRLDPQPINLAPRWTICIREAVETIARVAGFDGEITWDTDRPDGQAYRSLDAARASDLLEWSAPCSFEQGVTRTLTRTSAN